jgi:response regulator RpfG family c-di-GMP phosphodiesterase
LFAPVDVWDSLLSNQTYRPAWEEAAVLEYIRQESGKLFDPEITNRFLELLAQDPDLTK